MKRALTAMALVLSLSVAFVIGPAASFAANTTCPKQSGNVTAKVVTNNQQALSELLAKYPQLKNMFAKYTGQTTTNKKPSTTYTKKPTSNNKQSNNPQDTSSAASIEKQVAAQVNAQRAKNGLPALSYNSALAKMARVKSQDMINENYFGHNSPKYGSPFNMMSKFGISYSSAGENIAMGQRSVSEVMNGWMNSPGHRANILNSNYTQIGVGYAVDSNGRAYWTQEFIRP
ncbi:MAG: CAP domain-containing protein [Ignavibacteriales bacterium]